MPNKRPKSKWKFAIGTTSRVPDSGGKLHYLIADFDGDGFLSRQLINFLETTHCNCIIENTPNGWHLYTNFRAPMYDILKQLRKIGADPVWIEIAEARGYFFLAHKMQVLFPWPVEYMVLHYEEKT